MFFFPVCRHQVGELVRDVDSHGIHPEEEADEGVVGDVPQENTKAGVQDVSFVPLHVNIIMDTIEKIVYTDINEETYDNLPK